jgi:hypothetical protein
MIYTIKTKYTIILAEIRPVHYNRVTGNCRDIRN